MIAVKCDKCWASQVVLVKEPACQCIRDLGSIPESGRSPGGVHGNPLQYSCQENPMDRGAWQATVHRVAKSQTWLKQLSTHACDKCWSGAQLGTMGPCSAGLLILRTTEIWGYIILGGEGLLWIEGYWLHFWPLSTRRQEHPPLLW